MSAVEIPWVAMIPFVLDTKLIGRKRGTLILFLLLGAVSYSVMIWRSEAGRLVLNIGMCASV
jgi:hypothetical protein